MKILKQVFVIKNWDDFISNAEKYRDEDGKIPLEKVAQFQLDWGTESCEVSENCCALFFGREIFV